MRLTTVIPLVFSAEFVFKTNKQTEKEPAHVVLAML